MLEVRELVGGRARVEEPMLRRELARAGIRRRGFRAVTDPAPDTRRSSGFAGVRARILCSPRRTLACTSVERTRGRILFGRNGTA